MGPYKLASPATWLDRHFLFLQGTRLLLPKCQRENVKRSKKSLPRNRISDSIRQRIVDAARAHFFGHGFRSVTMDDLAQELGISKKTLYAHFPGKFDLLEAVLTDKLASVEATLKEVTRGHRRDFPATLEALLAGTRRELDEITPP